MLMTVFSWKALAPTGKCVELTFTHAPYNDKLELPKLREFSNPA